MGVVIKMNMASNVETDVRWPTSVCSWVSGCVCVWPGGCLTRHSCGRAAGSCTHPFICPGSVLWRLEQFTPEQKTTSISKNILGTFTVLYSNSTFLYLQMSSVFPLCRCRWAVLHVKAFPAAYTAEKQQYWKNYQKRGQPRESTHRAAVLRKHKNLVYF